METNKDLSHALFILEMAYRNPLTEIYINHYIKFMDTLPQSERDNILLNKKITLMIDKINGWVKQ